MSPIPSMADLLEGRTITGVQEGDAGSLALALDNGSTVHACHVKVWFQPRPRAAARSVTERQEDCMHDAPSERVDEDFSGLVLTGRRCSACGKLLAIERMGT